MSNSAPEPATISTWMDFEGLQLIRRNMSNLCVKAVSIQAYRMMQLAISENCTVKLAVKPDRKELLYDVYGKFQHQDGDLFYGYEITPER